MDAHTLDDLLAKDAIRERLHDYVRGMDRMDDDLARSVFHADAPADYDAMYRGTGHGFVDFVHAAHERALVHTHQLGSISISVEGERAVSEAYVTVTLRFSTPDGGLLDARACGRYLDRWERRAGRWAISARRYLHELDDLAPVTQAQYGTEGKRDRSDPSYAAFSGLAAT